MNKAEKKKSTTQTSQKTQANGLSAHTGTRAGWWGPGRGPRGPRGPGGPHGPHPW